MGVLGLFSFIRNEPNNFGPFQLHNTRAVFDAMNVLHFVSKTTPSLTQPFNGEYLAFDVTVEDFINKFRQCKIEPIFVFDGVHEVSRYFRSIHEIMNT